MRIINLSVSDWANMSYENSRAMRVVGLDAHSFKLQPHHYGYPEQSKVVDMNGLKKEIQIADVVQIFHSSVFILNLCRKYNKKKIYVYHTGTTYRRDKNGLNKLFNPYVIRCFTDQTEFIGAGMKGEYYFTCPVNTVRLISEIKKPDIKLIFGHFPSNKEIKGSELILSVMQKLINKYPERIQYNYSYDPVSHERQIKRMNTCDIYIELFAPMHEGNLYGCFGVTALEAAALGKIVVTNHTTKHIYRRFYGIDTPFITPQTEDELYSDLENLILSDREILYEKKKQTRQWVEQYHSYQAIGKLIKKLLTE